MGPDGLPIDGQMVDCEKSTLSEQAALRLGPAGDGGVPPLVSAPHFFTGRGVEGCITARERR